MTNDLAKRRLDAETRFTTLQKEREEHAQRVDEIDTELIRIQGDFRTINALIEEQKSPKKTDANTIDPGEKK